MEWRSVGRIAALALAVPTTAMLAYWLLLRKDQDDDDEEEKKMQLDRSRQTVIQMIVPRKAVGAVIGSRGSIIKKIQEESGAKASFSSRNDTERESEADRTLCIRGDPESAQRAEVMIRQIIADMPTVVTEEVLVPVYCLGRIIGRGGETIRGMSRTSKCKISIDRSQDAQGPEVPRVISITGPNTHIQLAKAMIEEKVNEEEEFRTKVAFKGASQEQGKVTRRVSEEPKEKVVLQSRVVEPEEFWDSKDQLSTKIPASEPFKEFMEVFVSAVEHSGHFWVQMISSASVNLDRMNEEMTTFYNNPNTAETYKVAELKVGDVVAAPFSHDNAWYRARVEGFEDGKVDLYFFDFGDDELLPVDSVRELKPEYLSLPVQAVECQLANVEPAGAEWSDESTDLFEQLTHCAEWNILSARTVGYATLGTEQRPCLQLIDNARDEPVDVAKELVAQGFAKWVKSPFSPPASTDTNTVTSTADSADIPIATAVSATALPGTVRPTSVPDPDPS